MHLMQFKYFKFIILFEFCRFSYQSKFVVSQYVNVGIYIICMKRRFTLNYIYEIYSHTSIIVVFNYLLHVFTYTYMAYIHMTVSLEVYTFMIWILFDNAVEIKHFSAKCKYIYCSTPCYTNNIKLFSSSKFRIRVIYVECRCCPFILWHMRS